MPLSRSFFEDWSAQRSQHTIPRDVHPEPKHRNTVRIHYELDAQVRDLLCCCKREIENRCPKHLRSRFLCLTHQVRRMKLQSCSASEWHVYVFPCHPERHRTTKERGKVERPRDYLPCHAASGSSLDQLCHSPTRFEDWSAQPFATHHPPRRAIPNRSTGTRSAFIMNWTRR
jgi:hypothetical protein